MVGAVVVVTRDPSGHRHDRRPARGSPEVAYLRLQAYAFSQDRLLMDVARNVVARRVRFDPDDADLR